MSQEKVLRDMLQQEQLPPPTWTPNIGGQPVQWNAPSASAPPPGMVAQLPPEAQPVAGKFYKGPDGKIYDEASAKAIWAQQGVTPQAPKQQMFRGPDGKEYTREQVEQMGILQKDTPIDVTSWDQWGKVAKAAGSGAVKGATTLGAIPFDITTAFANQFYPGANLSPPSQAAEQFVDKNLYQPRNRLERVAGATGAALPIAAATGATGPLAMLGTLVGGGLGQYLAESKITSNPDVNRAIGNLAPLAVGAIPGAGLAAMSPLLHYAKVPDTVHFLVDVGRHLLGQAPKSAGTSALQDLVDTLMKYGLRGLTSPVLQSQANQTNMPVPPATVPMQ